MQRNRTWENTRRKLKQEFEEKGITTCEVRLQGCWRDNALSFAHRHKRIFYNIRGNEHLLGDFNHVILSCVPCHMLIEEDRKLTKKTFLRLRGEI